jgi:opacity protein-like surface antigen
MLLASTTSFAGGNYKENYKGEAMPCPVELVLRDGLYIGLQAGYDAYRLATDFDSSVLAAPIVGDLGVVTADPRLAANGAVGGLFIGYGKYFPEFYNTYLGLEIFGNWTAASTDFEVTPITAAGLVDFLHTDVNVKNNYGISVLPGVKLNNATLFYVRLGYNWARFDYDETFTTGLGTVAPVTATSDANSTKGGFQYGVGIESTFMDGWSVRAEYNHTGFGKLSTDFDTEVAPSDNQFMLGLIYHIVM